MMKRGIKSMNKLILCIILMLIPSFAMAQQSDDNLVLIGQKGAKTPGYQPCKVADARCTPACLKKVEVAPFYIDKYETTWEDIQSCYDSGLCKKMDKIKLALEHVEDFDAQKNKPFGMTHDDAKAYCKARGMRLPTPAEWLLAAMGTQIHPYPWEEETATPGMYADELSNVGEFPHDVSPWGVYDMGGNALEWVEGNPMGEFEPGYKCMDPRTWPAMGNVRRVFIYEQFGVGLLGSYEDSVPTTVRCVKNAD